jgi:hypothetical protein
VPILKGVYVFQLFLLLTADIVLDIDIVLYKHLQLDFVVFESASKFLKVMNKVLLITWLMYPYHYTFNLDLTKGESQISFI